MVVVASHIRRPSWGAEVMEISCQPCPGSPEPAQPLHCSDVFLFWDGYLLLAACLLQGHNVMSKETTLVMYSKVKYFMQYYSNVMYFFLDILSFLPGVSNSGLFVELDSYILSSPGSCVPFSQDAEFLSVPTKC